MQARPKLLNGKSNASSFWRARRRISLWTFSAENHQGEMLRPRRTQHDSEGAQPTPHVTGVDRRK
jgi:hypothetical protein